MHHTCKQARLALQFKYSCELLPRHIDNRHGQLPDALCSGDKNLDMLSKVANSTSSNNSRVAAVNPLTAPQTPFACCTHKAVSTLCTWHALHRVCKTCHCARA
jgi:hypothetical protein